MIDMAGGEKDYNEYGVEEVEQCQIYQENQLCRDLCDAYGECELLKQEY